jgi:hypothetical protein
MGLTVSNSIGFHLRSHVKRKLDLDVSINEVYYTACYLLVILKDSCGELDCQEGFDPIFFG